MAGVANTLGRVSAMRAVVTLVCALASLTTVASTAQAATPSMISAINGFSAWQLPAAELGPQLAAIQAHGVSMVRSDAPWGIIEPAPPGALGHVWQWATTDAWVAALAAHHLTWEPILDYSVWWAKTCPGFCAPSSDGTYAAFAQAVASRYGVGGSFWAQNPQLPYYPAQIFEIWNEENLSTFEIDPALYGPLYAAARTAIHAVDGHATVIIGGLAEDSGVFDSTKDYAQWYLNEVFAADPALTGQVDGFGLHPYGAKAVDVEDWVVHIREDLVKLGEGAAPLYLTEFGWQSGGSAEESWRAQQMSDLALTLSHSSCGIAYMAPYDWINPPSLTTPGDFGFVDRSALSTTLRPAGTAWFAGLNEAAGQPQQMLCAAQGSTTSTGQSSSTSTGQGSTPSRSHHRRRHHRRHRHHRRRRHRA
jgi:hypothetical protein